MDAAEKLFGPLAMMASFVNQIGAERLHLAVLVRDARDKNRLVLVTMPTRLRRAALGALELVIVQDMFLNEIDKECGTVFLPLLPISKDGTFMNREHRGQHVRKVIEPRGDTNRIRKSSAPGAGIRQGRVIQFPFGGRDRNEVRRV
jgi:hypothetical protein